MMADPSQKLLIRGVITEAGAVEKLRRSCRICQYNSRLRELMRRLTHDNIAPVVPGFSTT